MPDYDFRHPDAFTPGTVGPPGQRVFYLQVSEDGRVATFKLEKQQVAALADSLETLLADLATPVEGVAAEVPFVEPVEEEWVVGGMGIGYDEVDDRILIAAQELQADDADDDEGAALEVDPILGDGPAQARLHVTRQQAIAFVSRARDLVSAGRPPCPFCGQPLDPAGHACPRMN